jgi:hypothetical protein
MTGNVIALADLHSPPFQQQHSVQSTTLQQPVVPPIIETKFQHRHFAADMNISIIILQAYFKYYYAGMKVDLMCGCKYLMVVIQKIRVNLLPDKRY